MASAVDETTSRRIITEAIPRIFPNPYSTPRKLLDLLLLGPVTGTELEKFWLKNGYESDIEGALKELAGARKRIAAFYLGPEGFSDPFKIEVPKLNRNGGLYRVTIAENKPPQNAAGFWAAHLGNGKPTKIIAGRPMFLQQEKTGALVRLEVLEGDAFSVSTGDPDPTQERFLEVRPYVAVANVRAMLSVFSFFDFWRRNHGHLHPEILASEEDTAAAEANLVVLGTPFDSARIRDLEEEALKALRRRNCAGRGSLYFHDDEENISKVMPNGCFRVWVHRRRSGSRCETLVNASSSELLAPICDFLTSEEEMKALIEEQWPGGSWNGFPSTFRIQFRVKLSAGGSRVKKIWVQQLLEGEDWIPDNEYRIQEGKIPRQTKSLREV